MDIAVIGVHHRLASIEIREAVSFTDRQKMETISHFLDHGIREVVILSTCNRSEIYILTDQLEVKINLIKIFFQTFSGIDQMERYLFVKINEEAIEHLFKVSAGLDSLVLGEDQILGQVKTAHEFAMKMGSSQKIFNQLFRQGITTAKNIKTTTKMSEQPLSISYIAIKFLKQKVGALTEKAILVVGTGEMSRLALNYLKEEEVKTIYLANRDASKSYDLRQQCEKIVVLAYEQRYDILPKVDFVLSATAAPHFIFKADSIPKIKKQLIMMDLALPRDIDPVLSKWEQIELYDLDGLQTIQDHHAHKRKELTKSAFTMIQNK